MKDNRAKFYNEMIDTVSSSHSDISDVMFLLSALWQMLENEENEFVNDIDSFENFAIFKTDLCDCLNIIMFNGIYDPFGDSKSYILTFHQIEDYKGYCQCTPDMEGYNEEHQCCGHDCDWTIPAVDIKKSEQVVNYQWKGDESDLWKFEEDFLNKRKEAKIRSIHRRIDTYNKQIERLSKMIEELTEEINDGATD